MDLWHRQKADSQLLISRLIGQVSGKRVSRELIAMKKGARTIVLLSIRTNL